MHVLKKIQEKFQKKKKKKRPAKKPNIRFWVHWLAEDAPKSVKDQFSKLCRLTSGAIMERAKNISKTPYLVWR